MNSALIKRLRKIATLESEDYGAEPQDHSSWQAADLIERQAAQIAHLQMALADTEALEAETSACCLKQAAQIEQMWDALHRCVEFFETPVEKRIVVPYVECMEACRTTPDQALEQFAAKVREQTAQQFEKRPTSRFFGIGVANEIRALKKLP